MIDNLEMIKLREEAGNPEINIMYLGVDEKVYVYEGEVYLSYTFTEAEMKEALIEQLKKLKELFLKQHLV